MTEEKSEYTINDFKIRGKIGLNQTEYELIDVNISSSSSEIIIKFTKNRKYIVLNTLGTPLPNELYEMYEYLNPEVKPAAWIKANCVYNKVIRNKYTCIKEKTIASLKKCKYFKNQSKYKNYFRYIKRNQNNNNVDVKYKKNKMKNNTKRGKYVEILGKNNVRILCVLLGKRTILEIIENGITIDRMKVKQLSLGNVLRGKIQLADHAVKRIRGIISKIGVLVAGVFENDASVILCCYNEQTQELRGIKATHRQEYDEYELSKSLYEETQLKMHFVPIYSLSKRYNVIFLTMPMFCCSAKQLVDALNEYNINKKTWRLKRKRLALNIGCQTGAALLSMMTYQRKIHRDVKPDNIALDVSPTDDVVATVIDFGFIKEIPGVGKEMSLSKCGTKGYWTLLDGEYEQSSIKKKELPEKRDAFSVVITTLEIALNRNLFLKVRQYLNVTAKPVQNDLRNLGLDFDLDLLALACHARSTMLELFCLPIWDHKGYYELVQRTMEHRDFIKLLSVNMTLQYCKLKATTYESNNTNTYSFNTSHHSYSNSHNTNNKNEGGWD